MKHDIITLLPVSVFPHRLLRNVIVIMIDRSLNLIED